jgi:hypothetical protein
MIPLVLWLVLRILTSIFAGMVSSIKPMNSIEARIPLLPTVGPISEWLDRALISPWIRWDAEWYLKIVTHGYSATDGTAPFHPLYPWLAVPLARIGLSPGFGLLLVGSIAGIALFYFFYKLALLDLEPKDSTFALMLFIFAPPAFILFAPYPEALFILTAVLCFYFARKKLWWPAGLMGALAALTRQQGIILFIPMAWELWENANRNLTNIRKQWHDWLALALIPAGLIFWIVYRAISLNDLHVSVGNFQQILYSLAISPSATQVVPDQQFIWPWLALKNSIVNLITQPDIDIWVDLLIGIVFIILLVIAWKKMRMSYRLYSVVIALVSFSFYTGSIHPYMGLPRHLFLAFPIFIGLAAFIKNKWLRLILITISAITMMFLLVLYVLQAWVA